MIDDIWTTVKDLADSPWAIMIVAMLAAVIVARIVVRLLRPLLVRAARSTSFTWDDQLAKALATPISVLFGIQGFRFALPWLPLDLPALETTRDAIAILTTITAIWMAFRGIDLTRTVLEQRSWAVERPASRSLIAIGARFSKVTVLLLGLIIALAQLGVSVASLIAGLGIGGLALALAAQKTIENLFGTISIGLDQPMREGDFVKVYDFVGTVEEIGLRSTRIRTLDRTVITVPNGELANQRIESYAVRDRIRLACTIRLVYETTSAQLRGVLADLEEILRRQPKIWPDTVVVRCKELAESSIDLEIMAWFTTSDWAEFQAIRQDVLIAFIEAIETRGTAIAFPTRSLHLTGSDAVKVVAAQTKSGHDRA